MVRLGEPGVDLDGVAELDDRLLVFARFRVFLSAGEEGGLLFRRIPGARCQNHYS
jgi:hypothetical protein